MIDDRRSVVVVGGTGMVGGICVRRALAHADVGRVTALGRRPVGAAHPSFADVVHQDLEDLAPVADELAGHDVALYCLGAYTGTLPDEEFRRVTVDVTVSVARALRAASPGIAFCFLSGQGADPNEKSRVAFARYKGMAENALRKMDFARLHVFRPGYIYPVEPRPEPNLGYRVMRALWPVAQWIYPNVGVTSEQLAAAMLQVGLHGTPGHAGPVLENRDIRAVRRTLGG